MADETPRRDPNAQEAMFFFLILKNLRNKADIDWEAVAQESKFKNANVAKTRFGQIKKTLGISSDPSPSPKKAAPKSTTMPTKVTKKGGRARAGKKGQDQAKTPTRSVVKQEFLKEEMSEDDEAPLSPSLTPIKREGGDLLTGEGFEALMGDGDPFALGMSRK